MTVRIGYNGKTIDFPQYVYRNTPPDYQRQTSGRKSASGIEETLNIRHDVMMDMAWRYFPNDDAVYATLKRNLKQLESHAQKGGAFTVALDSTDTFITTTTNSPASGASLVSLTSVTGIVAGRSYVLRNKPDCAVVKVDGIAGLDVTLAETLNEGYFAGDRFRAEMYWPARLADKTRPIIIERGPLWYDVELKFTEDVNDL